jgi:hypothetical protein
MYMAKKGHQQMKKKKLKRKDAPGRSSVAQQGRRGEGDATGRGNV